jgi:hypothetical protein
MKCIYCLIDKPLYNFKKREHVIPQCFGVFPKDNLVLHKTVCDDCNQYFGDKIELFMGRDSFEGFARIKQGIKPKKPLKSRRRIKSKIRNGEHKGVIVTEEKVGNDGQVKIEKVPQVGFFNGIQQEYVYYEKGKIPTKDHLLKIGFLLKNERIWIIGDENEYKTLVKELEEKGIKLKHDVSFLKDETKGPPVLVESTITIDKTIMRGLCKIAFNYLALQAGTNFVLSDNFDPIRNFIRYAKGDSDNFFFVNQPPILQDDKLLEKFGAKVTRGHLIVLSWAKEFLISKLSLFNEFTYRIYLCSGYKGIWIPIKVGHHFDLDNKEVTKLISVSKNLLI